AEFGRDRACGQRPEAVAQHHGDGRLQDRGAAIGSVQIGVYADNAKALAFYRRCGFVETARKPEDDEGRPLE
ncbi:hypothetical protein IAI13_36305, partial [Escherichia coli]|nr:hypothetical protein [Escherichia coli]